MSRCGAAAAATGVACEVDGKEAELAGQFRVLEGEGAADRAVALGVRDGGGAQEFVPVRCSDGERRQHDGPSAAQALATKAFRSGGGGKANRVSHCARPQAGQME